MEKKLYGTPVPFDLFTRGKQAELAIAYNLAYDNVEKYIRTLQALDDPLTNTDLLDDKVFAYLRNYLWKGNAENKNTAGYELMPEEKRIIKKLLNKLWHLRNFFSHYWHENSMVSFDTELKQFVQDRHDRACGKLLEEKTADANLYLESQWEFPLFDEHGRIKQDGRIFFLSFFLNKGEMQGVLQRLKGYKRTNMPAYQFKHKIYTFYCHREGSSWDSTGVDNAVLEQKEEDEQKRVLYGRQANRIFNYLKDIPALSREEALPLLLSTGHWVNSMEDLLLFIQQRELLPGFRFYKKEEDMEEEEFGDEGEQNEARKGMEKKEREGYRRFRMPGNDSYEFEISYAALKHIVTDIFLDSREEQSIAQDSPFHFKGVLEESIKIRKYIYEGLKQEGDRILHPDKFLLPKRPSSIYIDYSAQKDSIENMFYTGNEWRHIPISPTPRVEKVLIEWHSIFLQDNKGEVNRRKKLLNLIRPLDASFDNSPYEKLLRSGKKHSLPIRPEPLLFHLAYYYKEQDTKKRKEDNFLEWGLRYLMDRGLVPDWHFEMEKLKYDQKMGEPESPYKLKKETVWEKQIPENYRLRITDNQVNIGIEEGGRTYRLRIGEKIMKYLLYCHFRGENITEGKCINGFLKAVTRDLAKIHGSESSAIRVSSLDILEDFSMSELFYKTKVRKEQEKEKKELLYREQVFKYLEAKKEWIHEQLLNRQSLNRNQKNSVILYTYRLFNFKGTEGNKFLRKNEYEQMSICHFMLNQDKGKVKDLLEKSFKLRKRLPEEVRELLYEVIESGKENLDDLFISVLTNRKEFLREKINQVRTPGISNKQIKKDIVGFLDIYLEDSLLNPEELEIRNQKRATSLDNLPFAVHPALTLKYFYPTEFARQGFRKEGGDYTNLFYTLRHDGRLSGFLSDEGLREKPAAKILAEYEQEYPEDKALERFGKKWIGTVNELKTRDILLFLIAEDYLKLYDAETAREFRKIKDLKKLKLDELFKKGAPMTLFVNQPLRAELTGIYKKEVPQQIHLLLRMHQLDDYFFRAQKGKLIRLAIFYLNWRLEEMDLYKDSPDDYNKIIKWPDGSSEEKALTMGQLVEARRVNAGHAGELMGYIFNYEALVLNDHVNTEDKRKKQETLLNFCMTKRIPAQFIEFEHIKSWDLINSDDVKDKIQGLRNGCLHNTIPINGSFRIQSLPDTEVGKALLIERKIGKDRTALNIYKLDNEQ